MSAVQNKQEQCVHETIYSHLICVAVLDSIHTRTVLTLYTPGLSEPRKGQSVRNIHFCCLVVLLASQHSDIGGS